MKRISAALLAASIVSIMVGGLAVSGYFKYRFDALGRQVEAAALISAPARSQAVLPSEVILDHEVPRHIGDIVKSGTAAELAEKRSALVDYIWAGQGIPKAGDLIPVPTDGPGQFSDYQTLELLIDAGQAGLSRPLFVQSKHTHGCLFLYHSGHDEGTSTAHADASVLMNLALSLGCDVIHSSMPNDGDNKQAKDVGDHNTLGQRETDSFTPLRSFLDPALRSIDWAMTNNDYSQLIVAGRSGGGWTAGLLGAIDPRIDATVVINGSMPFHVKGRRVKDVGDWEQTHSRIYDLIDYGDLYLLSALEEGRSAYYSWNKYDPCCFAGARARVFFPLLQHQADDWGIAGLEYHVEDDPRAGHSIMPSSLGAVAALILSHQRML